MLCSADKNSFVSHSLHVHSLPFNFICMLLQSGLPLETGYPLTGHDPRRKRNQGTLLLSMAPCPLNQRALSLVKGNLAKSGDL